MVGFYGLDLEWDKKNRATDAFCQGGKKQEAAREDRELKSSKAPSIQKLYRLPPPRNTPEARKKKVMLAVVEREVSGYAGARLHHKDNDLATSATK